MSDAKELADLPSPETMLDCAIILENPRYLANPQTGDVSRLVDHKAIEVACAALRHCAALRSPSPSVPEGYVSVELLQAERAVADSLRAQNDKLRAAIYAASPSVPEREAIARVMLDELNKIAPAVENLSCHQEQCDMDGVMVKVSRQALNEVLATINAVAEIAAKAILAHPDKRAGERDAQFAMAIKLLKQNTGLLCESGNLNNYRNLSDEELGKAWVETATRTAEFLNEVEGITSTPAEQPDDKRAGEDGDNG